MNRELASLAGPSPKCRLCGSETSPKFELRVLQKHQVRYYRCNVCASLQTEPPYWLDEAYASSLSVLDTFAGQRTLNNLAASFVVSKTLRLPNVLDFGGNDGLLCRLLRDYSINCFVSDKYAKPKYAQGFDVPDFAVPDLRLAFEVMEHLPEPSVDLDAIFDGTPRALLVSTMPYLGEGPHWSYLAPETGQHVFFYSPKALRDVAAGRGYDIYFEGQYILMTRPELRSRARVTRRLLGRLSIRAVRAILNLVPAGGVMNDFDRLRAGLGAKQA